MTSDQSLQFLEHLRRNDHLTKSAASNGQGSEQGAVLGPQGLGPPGLGPQAKLWELTKLSASDFADD